MPGGLTVTVMLGFVEPPVPEHESEYVVEEDGETMVGPPLVAPPVEKLVPVQEVAFEQLQESEEECPVVIDVGLAENEHEGIGYSTLSVGLEHPGSVG